MKLYLKVTKDKYELPIAVAESPRELAKMTGDDAKSISKYIWMGSKVYHRIEVEDDEDGRI